MECSAPSARACQGLSIHTRFIVSQWQPPSSAAAHLVHPGRQQLHDGEVLAGALHDVPRGPVVEGAPHRHAAAAVAPCARGRLRWRSDARAPRSFARARLHAAAGCAQARQAAQDRRLRSGGRLQARRLVAQERRDRVPQAAGRAREPRLPTRGPRALRAKARGAHTMTVGTSLGCAGQPARPWNSAAWSRPSGAWSTLGMGSMGICGLYVSGEPGLHGGDVDAKASSPAALPSPGAPRLVLVLPCGPPAGAGLSTNARAHTLAGQPTSCIHTVRPPALCAFPRTDSVTDTANRHESQ